MLLKLFTAALMIMSSSLFAADLTLTYTQEGVAAIDWEGMGDMDGDGTVTFGSFGDTQSATLSILCNKTAGYQVTLYSANATSGAASVLKNGENTIAYTATMDTAGIQNATIAHSTLILNNVSQHSLDVNFTGGALPLNGSNQANELSLNFTMATFDGTLRPEGVYTDTITATVALN